MTNTVENRNDDKAVVIDLEQREIIINGEVLPFWVEEDGLRMTYETSSPILHLGIFVFVDSAQFKIIPRNEEGS